MKKTMQNSNGSSYVINTDDHKIIDISEFINMDSIVCKSFDVVTGEPVQLQLLNWWRTSSTAATRSCSTGTATLARRSSR